jgi:hypothetical protein
MILRFPGIIFISIPSPFYKVLDLFSVVPISPLYKDYLNARRPKKRGGLRCLSPLFLFLVDLRVFWRGVLEGCFVK